MDPETWVVFVHCVHDSLRHTGLCVETPIECTPGGQPWRSGQSSAPGLEWTLARSRNPPGVQYNATWGETPPKQWCSPSDRKLLHLKNRPRMPFWAKIRQIHKKFAAQSAGRENVTVRGWAWGQPPPPPLVGPYPSWHVGGGDPWVDSRECDVPAWLDTPAPTRCLGGGNVCVSV